MDQQGGIEKDLGTYIKLARLKAGLTQQAACQQIGLSYSTLAKIERGAIKAPSIITIGQLARLFKMSLDELVGGTLGLPSNLKQKVLSKSGIGFVYFDINGCLVRFFHKAFTQIAKETEAPADLIETTFWHYNDAVCRGDMSMGEFNEQLAKELGQPDFDWRHYYLAAVDPISETHNLINWAVKHYNVGLLSNIMPGLIGAMRSKKILPDVEYATIIDSSEVGAIKPEPHIYEIAAERAGCPPAEILLVDDSRANIVAAESLGWRVLWFNAYHPEESISRVKSALELP